MLAIFVIVLLSVRDYWKHLDANYLSKTKVKVTVIPVVDDFVRSAGHQIQVVVPGKLMMTFGLIEELTEPPNFRPILRSSDAVTAYSDARSRIIHVYNGMSNISFVISADSHSWHLEKILHNNVEAEMFGPSIRSVLRGMYTCNRAIQVRDALSQIPLFRIHGLTVLPEFSNNMEFRTNMVANWTCIEYMTIGVLMGLLVAFMFLFTAILAIVFIMDIRSVDQFDTPSK